jgi:malate dehydrogenase (quinone)
MSDGHEIYDVAIVGAGASGSALYYILSRYTNIKRIALIEKYREIGSVNSNAKNNSQTLHTGEIETNYSMEKVRQVRVASLMVPQYVNSLPESERNDIMQVTQKMVLGVGHQEVATLEERYDELKTIFPELQKLNGAQIAEVEPEVMRGRNANEPVAALFTKKGYAVDYGALAKSFAASAQQNSNMAGDVLLGHSVETIEKTSDGFLLRMRNKTIRARIVIVDADAYSLSFAKRLGYGKNFSLIPIAASFYFTPIRLRGKVYQVQKPRMPFAAVHGDPDLTRNNETRWGPTARFYPVLEARRLHTIKDFFRASGMHRPQTWISFLSILLEPIRFWYLFKNFLYDLPLIGKHIFLPELRRIVPTLTARDLTWAKEYGGMRLQRVDTNTRELLLGEGKIVGENIIFNMTPSPGASVCLYNAMRDAELIEKFSSAYVFDKTRMLRDLCPAQSPEMADDVSLKESYAA